MNSFINNFYHTFSEQDFMGNSFIWQKEAVPFFEELIVGWNAFRPEKGSYFFSISVKIDDDWSPLLPFSLWGKDSQRSFESEWGCIKVFQDTINVINGKKG